jgi:hypothetical protein
LIPTTRVVFLARQTGTHHRQGGRQSEAKQLGRWQLDCARLHAHLRERGLRPIDADTELHATEGDHDIVYEAHLDEVPDTAVEVDPAALPSWLRPQTI